MTVVTLKNVDGNFTEATVDNVTLVRGGDPQDLTEDQIERLKDTGVKLDYPDQAEETDPIDDLTGEDLEQAVVDADIEGRSSMTAEEKRAALKAEREGGDE